MKILYVDCNNDHFILKKALYLNFIARVVVTIYYKKE